jgi:hypothetical protein
MRNLKDEIGLGSCIAGRVSLLASLALLAKTSGAVVILLQLLTVSQPIRLRSGIGKVVGIVGTNYLTNTISSCNIPLSQL